MMMRGLILPVLIIAAAGGLAGEITAQERVNVNTAGNRELQSLPGIGPKIADKFIAERQVNGPYRSLEDLQRRVMGVNGGMIESLKKQGLYAGNP
ncbi:MAG: helix-hairpin-helix domain-containing protein [PVC group bacterium]